ncbi:MAG: large subunit ribosomal protein L15 [Parcubacteria group bacterium Gr01-1014_8]|nr:MAG: large subunit ribosomal protein L15 [Parcubacteria group bacterium Gr01-1014_8]
MTGLHSLKRTSDRPKQRVGRGQSSGRGKTSGRGTKGQNARSGRKKRPEWRDIIKKLPKRRGYGKNRGRTVVSDRQRAVIISLEQLERAFDAGAEVTPKTLKTHDLLSERSVKFPFVKIVGGGTLSKKLSFKDCAVTASAKVAIEKAGGTVA